MEYTYMTERLRGEYREVFEKTELYGTFSEVNTEVQEDLMLNLYDLLLTAQQEENSGKDHWTGYGKVLQGIFSEL